MEIKARYETILERITGAARRCGRDASEITLIAVSKTMPASAIRAAFDAGLRDFGENKVQELAAKCEDLADLSIRWHFIGHLQSNKVKRLLSVPNVLVHSVDSTALAREINERTHEDHVQDVMVQVNTSGEETKFGVAPEGVSDLVTAVLALPRLRLLGFMTLGPLTEDEEAIRSSFRMLAGIRDRLPAPGRAGMMLSMGMSGDFEIAIEEGATHVRVGTALFGPR
jgi:pyridoxal phosphate enzyme (YggS family)